MVPFPQVFLTIPLYVRFTCPDHLIHLFLITRKISGEQYRSLSSSLCSFLHSPVTSSPFGLNNLLSTYSQKPVLHTVRSSASSLNLQFPLVSWRSSSGCLRLLSLLLFTSILPSILPSIICFRRQFLHNIRPIELAFLLYAVCMMTLSYLSICNNSSFQYVCCMYDGPLLLVYM